MGAISALQQQVQSLPVELSAIRTEIVRYNPIAITTAAVSSIATPTPVAANLAADTLLLTGQVYPHLLGIHQTRMPPPLEMEGACLCEAEDKFFDARDVITSVSDLGSDCSNCCPNPGFGNCVLDSIGYEFWTKNPESVHDHCQRFLNWMGVSLDWNPDDGAESGDM
ncbi:hypothetical protein F0562_016439 [Nyssa sinensis]|uniref:Uncharacterized protein n=1 Tax=Nyssa sinensis TaxID=561372 RepID=A0A5J4ZNK0_9ASTE|nr:hypothetical protein F0562_016439 [Nyssa sinensis]